MFQTKTISYRLITCLLTVILLLPFTASASFMGTATFSSIPPGARLEPVQILIDDNLAGGAGIANVIDYNTSSPLGYFIVGRGETNGTFPWIRNFSTDRQVQAQKIVRYKNRYYILYTEYVQFATPNDAFLLQLDAATGAVLSNERLIFDAGITEINGVDLVVSDPYEMLFVVCNGKNNGQEVNLLGAYEMRSNTMLDARIIEYSGSNIHADALTKTPSSFGADEHLFIGGRVKHSNYYEEVYVQGYLFDNNVKQFFIFNHNVFQWNTNNRLFMSRLKYNEYSGNLILAAQTWEDPSDAGDLELWQIDIGSISLTNVTHYNKPGRMFNSDINIDRDGISLAGPNNRFGAGLGNVIAHFSHSCSFQTMNVYPFNGMMFETTAMHGPTFGFPFVMATTDAGNATNAKWTVGNTYKGKCDVIKAPLKLTDKQINHYQALQETAIPSLAKDAEIMPGREELIYEIECGKSGNKQATGIVPATNEAAYKFAQNHQMAEVKTTGSIKNVSLFDINGRKVADYVTTGSSVSINKYDILPGIYVLSFEINGIAKREKMVVH